MAEHWFDIRTGDMIVGQAALEQRLEESDPGDVVPLVELLTADEFDVPYQDYDKYPRRLKRTEEECLEYGSWVLRVLEGTQAETTLSREHLERLSRLGLGMAYAAIIKTFGDIWNYREALGKPYYSRPGQFDDWSTRDFIINAEELADHLGKKPTQQDYSDWARQKRGPNSTIIQERIPGGLRNLNELIGFPNIHSWDEDQYLEWGVKFMQANGGLEPTQITVDLLSQRKRGPSYRSIFVRFEGFANYRQEVVERYEEGLAAANERASLLDDKYRTIFSLLGDEEAYTEHPDAEQRLSYVARYDVARQCLPDINRRSLSRLAYQTNSDNFIAKLRQANPQLTAGHIESVAATYSLYDDIWPSHELDAKHLRISERDLTRARRRSAARRQKTRRKHLKDTG